jgi:hypothetical protein
MDGDDTIMSMATTSLATTSSMPRRTSRKPKPASKSSKKAIASSKKKTTGKVDGKEKTCTSALYTLESVFLFSPPPLPLADFEYVMDVAYETEGTIYAD